MAVSPMGALREVWRDLGMRGRCYCRRVPGAYRDVWIVHHGRSYEDDWNDHRVVERFVKRGRTALRKAGLSAKAFLFQLDSTDQRLRRGGRYGEPVERLARAAVIEADRLPNRQWRRAEERGDWVGVRYSGDRVEMWERVMERSKGGRLYRIIDIAWSSNTHLARSYETTAYIGARRGAWLWF